MLGFFKREINTSATETVTSDTETAEPEQPSTSTTDTVTAETDSTELPSTSTSPSPDNIVTPSQNLPNDIGSKESGPSRPILSSFPIVVGRFKVQKTGKWSEEV